MLPEGELKGTHLHFLPNLKFGYVSNIRYINTFLRLIEK